MPLRSEVGQRSKFLKEQKDECYTILFLESASKELESLAVHMPNVSDSDARALAVRMYYIEVSNGMSPLMPKQT